MALERSYATYETPTGATYECAYIRIKNGAVDANSKLTFTVEWFVNKSCAKELHRQPWRTKQYVMDIDYDHSGANIKTQAYEWLKTQKEFIKCIEV